VIWLLAEPGMAVLADLGLVSKPAHLHARALNAEPADRGVQRPERPICSQISQQ
jgi:hypothetical protein